MTIDSVYKKQSFRRDKLSAETDANLNTIRSETIAIRKFLAFVIFIFSHCWQGILVGKFWFALGIVRLANPETSSGQVVFDFLRWHDRPNIIFFTSLPAFLDILHLLKG